MSTISLYANKTDLMPDLIQNTKSSVGNLKENLRSLNKKMLTIDSSVCDVENEINAVTSAIELQEKTISSLEFFENKLDEFINDTKTIDHQAATQIDQNKEEFYKKYSYLRPASENVEKQSLWDKIKSKCKKVGQWCKENWKYIVSVVVTVAVIAAIVVLSVVTFGAAVVMVAAAVGAVVGLASQLAADLISFAITGDWDGTWQSYVGSALGGAVGGILMLSGNPMFACCGDAAISTFLGENLECMTGGEKKSIGTILFDTGLSAVTAAALSKLLEKPTSKLCKTLSKKFPSVCRRFSGSWSYEVSFNRVITRMKNKGCGFTYKTIRNGIVSGLYGSILENITQGIKGGFEEIYNECTFLPKLKFALD